MNFQQQIKETLGLKEDPTTKSIEYQFETEVGLFSVEIYPKSCLINIDLETKLYEPQKTQEIYQKIEQVLHETIIKDTLTFKILIKRASFYYLLGDYHQKISERIQIKDKFLSQSIDILGKYGLASRPYFFLANSDIKTIQDLVNKTEYEVLMMHHSGEPSLKNIKETLQKLV